jgi:hypothetical protein
LQKGFTIVGHSLGLTFSPGRTRKSFEVIFIFIPSVSRPAWVALITHAAQEDVDAAFARPA